MDDDQRLPITSYAELLRLIDAPGVQAEMTEGYRDGFNGLPCGGNRSRVYWHGWRNGRVDRGLDPKTEDMAALAADERKWAAFAQMPIEGNA